MLPMVAGHIRKAELEGKVSLGAESDYFFPTIRYTHCFILQIKASKMHIPKKVLGIIPARYGSTRYPGKPLVQMGDKTMIQRVYEQCMRAHSLDRVVVATDDDRILDHVDSFGGIAIRTSGQHVSGTDRCAEVAAQFPGYDYVINIQGDEPFIDPAHIDLVASALMEGREKIATLAVPIRNSHWLDSPHVVKVVFGEKQQALYFSRYPIPYLRAYSVEQAIQEEVFFQHIGLYGFDRPTLLALTELPVSRLESMESLEQLRWLDHGFGIAVRIAASHQPGIDTPEDMERALAQLSSHRR